MDLLSTHGFRQMFKKLLLLVCLSCFSTLHALNDDIPTLGVTNFGQKMKSSVRERFSLKGKRCLVTGGTKVKMVCVRVSALDACL